MSYGYFSFLTLPLAPRANLTHFATNKLLVITITGLIKSITNKLLVESSPTQSHTVLHSVIA